MMQLKFSGLLDKVIIQDNFKAHRFLEIATKSKIVDQGRPPAFFMNMNVYISDCSTATLSDLFIIGSNWGRQ